MSNDPYNLTSLHRSLNLTLVHLCGVNSCLHSYLSVIFTHTNKEAVPFSKDTIDRIKNCLNYNIQKLDRLIDEVVELLNYCKNVIIEDMNKDINKGPEISDSLKNLYVKDISIILNAFDIKKSLCIFLENLDNKSTDIIISEINNIICSIDRQDQIIVNVYDKMVKLGQPMNFKLELKFTQDIIPLLDYFINILSFEWYVIGKKLP